MSFLPTEEEDNRVLAELDAERRRKREDELLKQHAVILALFRKEQAEFARAMGHEREAQYWERRAG